MKDDVISILFPVDPDLRFFFYRNFRYEPPPPPLQEAVGASNGALALELTPPLMLRSFHNDPMLAFSINSDSSADPESLAVA